MRSYIFLGFLLLSSPCIAKKTNWGERSFVLETLQNWSEVASVRSCISGNKNSIFLFEHSDQYYLVTQYSDAFDIASISAKSDPIWVDANGGLGRYVEIQMQFETLRRLPARTVKQEDFLVELSGTPEEHCSF
jgi:hypothetical protein